MPDQETLTLLKQSETEVKKSIQAIKNILDPIQNPDFKLIILKHKDALKAENTLIEEKLTQAQMAPADANKIAEAVSKVMVNAKLLIDNTDKHIAGLIFDACNDSLKHLYIALNANTLADKDVKDEAQNTTEILVALREELVGYL